MQPHKLAMSGGTSLFQAFRLQSAAFRWWGASQIAGGENKGRLGFPPFLLFFSSFFRPRCSRDLQILRRVRLRIRDLLNTKQRTRVIQRHFGGKTWQLLSFYYGFSHECRGGENKISNVKSLIILQSGERVISFTKNNKANFCSEKW